MLGSLSARLAAAPKGLVETGNVNPPSTPWLPSPDPGGFPFYRWYCQGLAKGWGWAVTLCDFEATAGSV